MSESFKQFLIEQKIPFFADEPMARHTTFRIGGAAEFLILPQTAEQLSLVLQEVQKTGLPLHYLGRGSNLLVSDGGVKGAVVCLAEMNEISVEGNRITAFAGASLSALCRTAREHALAGLEFAYGIPGSVGGALFMNAGAYGGEMSQVVVSAECMDQNGQSHHVEATQMALGYRESVFRENGWIILSATVELVKGNREEIHAKMEELLTRRKEKQPLEFPSAGSTFKRPTGYFAGALIEQSGLKGFSVGEAQVSEKHAGFLINRGGATAGEVLELIQKVRQTVHDDSGVWLEPEVLFWGDE